MDLFFITTLGANILMFKIRYLLVLFSLIYAISFSAPLKAVERKLSSDKIFSMTEPSVVSISNEEGAGTGIVISSSGLILTNFHVVCSALPFTVKVKVLTSMKRYKEMEFNNVKVIKIHKIYDLALLKIKTKKFKFRPIKWKSGQALKTGEICYAIGNPGIDNENLTNTITNGLVSCADRKYENLSYIQTSAQVNPGNSGGPLLNSYGNFIGVVTFKATNIEGIGFAIPSAKIKPKDFIDPSLKKGDKKKAAEYSEKAESFIYKAHNAYNQSVKKKLFMIYALYCYKMNLFYMPNNPDAYCKIGGVYFELGEEKLAKAYLNKTLSMDDNFPEAYKLLGVMQEEQKNGEEACKLWLKGAFLPKKNSAYCAYNAGIYYFKKKRYIEATYLAWKGMRGKTKLHGAMCKLFNDASSHVPFEMLKLLSLKESLKDFSFKEMTSLAEKEKIRIAKKRKKEKMLKKEDEKDEDTFDDIIGG